MTTFAQLSARLKNFLRGWLLVLGLKEGLVEFATVCVKSVVMLGRVRGMDRYFWFVNQTEKQLNSQKCSSLLLIFSWLYSFFLISFLFRGNSFFNIYFVYWDHFLAFYFRYSRHFLKNFPNSWPFRGALFYCLELLFRL